ncbi:MAG TPA: hypothetical protein VG897_03920 [Terriglobales bacterium]|nr:hypothetical protein [Terriglobales bacterium]
MKFQGRIRKIAVLLLAVSLSAPVWAGSYDLTVPAGSPPADPIANLNIPAPRARMSPELALALYNSNARWQAQQLGESADTTTIVADLPGASKRGEFTLKRMFSAPKSLAFKSINFVGDGFVKTNVIARLLQSEADHVQKDQPSDTAITDQNYKFNYKGTEEINGRLSHVFQVKPRHKRSGLFKGKVYIDAYSGSMLRAEGRLVKSPSLFIKKVEFVQDYAQVGEFNLITHIHSVADTRIIGEAVVDITHRDYQVRSLAQVLSSTRNGKLLSTSFENPGN